MQPAAILVFSLSFRHPCRGRRAASQAEACATGELTTATLFWYLTTSRRRRLPRSPTLRNRPVVSDSMCGCGEVADERSQENRNYTFPTGWPRFASRRGAVSL